MIGYHVEGDTTVDQTRWWNHLWLVWFGWKTVAVFEAKTDKAFRVGYQDKWGKVYINTKLHNTSAKHGQFAKSEMLNEGERIPVNHGYMRTLEGFTHRWPHFNVLVGFEDCTFFAIDVNDVSVPITLIKRVGREKVTDADGTSL